MPTLADTITDDVGLIVRFRGRSPGGDVWQWLWNNLPSDEWISWIEDGYCLQFYNRESFVMFKLTWL